MPPHLLPIPNDRLPSCTAGEQGIEPDPVRTVGKGIQPALSEVYCGKRSRYPMIHRSSGEVLMRNQTPPPRPVRSTGIRFESIGGLGAHAAGQVLAAAAVLRLGLNGAHFSSYGSEKKGSAVKSYVRLGPADQPIRSSAPIDAPDYLVIFHSALLKHPATLAGLKAGGTLIYTAPPHEQTGDVPPTLSRVPRGSRIIRIDALRIAVEEKSRPNAVLLGTLAAAIDFLDAQAILAAFAEGFARKHPEAVAANERAFRRGMQEFEVIEGVAQGEGDIPTARPSAIWGYETAPLGGVIPLPGNTISNDLSTSRAGWMPVLNSEKCIHCGLCDLVCPDFCLVWEHYGGEEDEDDGVAGPATHGVRLQGIDYHYCKGCQRCIETCPTEAMSRQVEEPGMAERLRIALPSLSRGEPTRSAARV
jgi:pyruvate ferredoxin oxidoreductase gamma subunit